MLRVVCAIILNNKKEVLLAQRGSVAKYLVDKYFFTTNWKSSHYLN